VPSRDKYIRMKKRSIDYDYSNFNKTTKVENIGSFFLQKRRSDTSNDLSA
jgi:hypothetical protein